MNTKPIASSTTPSSPLVNPVTGMMTFAWMKWFQNIGQIINQAFDTQGNVSGSSLPAPTVTTLGGVLAAPAVSHEWVNSIDSSGAPHLSQPSFSDVSGSASSQQVPSLSGISGQLQPSQISGTLTASQVPALSSLRGSVTASQVPQLSALNGQITTAQLPPQGLNVTITTAKLTGGGTNGSMTFTQGILTSEVPAT